MDMAMESYLNSLGGILESLTEDARNRIISEIQEVHIPQSGGQSTPAAPDPSD